MGAQGEPPSAHAGYSAAKSQCIVDFSVDDPADAEWHRKAPEIHVALRSQLGSEFEPTRGNEIEYSDTPLSLVRYVAIHSSVP
jgi:hypothetical protein